MPTPRKYAHAGARQREYRQRLAAAAAAPHAPGGGTGAAVPPARTPQRWQALIRQAGEWLAVAGQEMEQNYEEQSEAWQESERGGAHLKRLEAVQEALALLEPEQQQGRAP
jgi:hypothetical protein